jgi:uncharacterized protein (TIGR03085 family)
MDDMAAPPSTYPPAMIAEHGRSVARLERAALCDTLEAVGADAPTLCGGWDTRHLAAHLALREGTLGAAAAQLPKVGDRTVDLVASRRTYADLVASVRSGPPRISLFSLPGVDKRLNLLEYFVHHEDVRRAAPGWSPRAMPDWAEDKLWRGVSVAAKMTMRRSPVGVRLERSDGAETVDAVSGDPRVTLRGRPSELSLYAFGRESVADVEIVGDDDTVRAFTGQSFSV